MPGISQRVVHIAFERHVTFGIEADCTTQSNHRADVMIVPVIPQAGEAGTFESATQDNVIEIGTVIEDGVIEPHEKAVIDEELYQAIAKLQQHSTLVYRVFCAPEKGDARECAAPGAVASNFMEKTNA